MTRAGSSGEVRKDSLRSPVGSPGGDERGEASTDGCGIFHVIEQLAVLEGALYGILDGLKSNATHVSFFCREYWGSSACQAQLSLEKLNCNDRLKRQVQQACVLESLSLAVSSHLCTGLMQGVSVTIRSRLRNLLYYVHENCLVLLDLVCQRWLRDAAGRSSPEAERSGHCPENLNLDILVRMKRYRRLRGGEHIMALRQQNEMIANVVRQLCRGAAPKRPALTSARSSTSPVPGDHRGSTGSGAPGRGSLSSSGGGQVSVLSAVNDILTSRTPLDRLRAGAIRSKMLQLLRFKALLSDGSDPDCPWPPEDPYDRYGVERFAADAPIIWFETLPPMLPNLDLVPKLPPPERPDAYSLILDLDETLVHYFEADGEGGYDIRPGMQEFLLHMNQLGYEVIIFTAATQDYADWVIDQIDPDGLVHHRLYRQHALPWGPIFVKDLSRIGRDLDRTLIIDNVQENFMLQPRHGIFILTWYDDPTDTALSALTPLLEELLATRSKVPDILEKYRDTIPMWAGFDQASQLDGGSELEYDPVDDGYGDIPVHQQIAGVDAQALHSQVAPASAARASAPAHYGAGQVAPAQQARPHAVQLQPSRAPQQLRPQAQPQLRYTQHQPVAASVQAAAMGTASAGTGPAASSYLGSPALGMPYHQMQPASGYMPPARVASGGGCGGMAQLQQQQRPPRQQQQQLPQRSPPSQALLQQAHARGPPVGRAGAVGQHSPQQQMQAAGASPARPPARPAGPAFGAGGISGPYQAAPPPGAASWSRAGLGPHQAPRRR